MADGPPVGEQLGLQAEHLPLLLGLGVVVAEQVQHAVHGEQVHLVGERVARLAGLRPGELRAEHDVAEQCRTGVGGVGPPRLLHQLVHRERQDIGGPRLVHPALVQLAHHLLGDDEDRQLGRGVDAHGVEGEPRHRGHERLVDGHARLVADLDRHVFPLLHSLLGEPA
ncbi:hypothetical protein BJF90_23955 [Pseudonocardia sp. CNS-004]|nr:hypothetical protein BJF90_23955 [Pseudonocardia sp. CNS-004]